MFALLIVTGSKVFYDFVNDILSSLHFDSFNWKPSARDFVTNLSTCDCIELVPFFPTHLARVVSSTYFQMFVFATLRSLIIIRNNQGPGLVPWGTPADTARHSDTQPQLNFTLCLLFVRKSKIQHMIDSGKSYKESFWARTWWSI